MFHIEKAQLVNENEREWDEHKNWNSKLSCCSRERDPHFWIGKAAQAIEREKTKRQEWNLHDMQSELLNKFNEHVCGNKFPYKSSSKERRRRVREIQCVVWLLLLAFWLPHLSLSPDLCKLHLLAAILTSRRRCRRRVSVERKSVST